MAVGTIKVLLHDVVVDEEDPIAAYYAPTEQNQVEDKVDFSLGQQQVFE